MSPELSKPQHLVLPLTRADSTPYTRMDELRFGRRGKKTLTKVQKIQLRMSEKREAIRALGMLSDADKDKDKLATANRH